MSRKQSNLHSFFQIRPEKSIHRKYFIYDPEHFRAFFATEPLPSDKFIIRKSGIQLYIRPFSSTCEAVEAKENETQDLIDLTNEAKTDDSSNKSSLLPHKRLFVSDIRSLSIAASNIPVSLHKSNLQKAIRRGNKDAALFSAWALLHLDRMELLRRLPIIMVEDVTLFDRSPILIWLMMATTNPSQYRPVPSDELYYSMTEHDARIVLAMVQYLAEQTKVSFCAQMHDKEVLPETSSTNTILENETKDENPHDTIASFPDRSKEEEIMPTIDQDIGVTTSLATTTESIIDYRHISHEDMEKVRLQILLQSITPTDNSSAQSVLIDCLLALLYRIKYGGMLGDMELLTEVVDYFRMPSSSSMETMPLKYFYLWQTEPRNLELSLRPCHLLPEAIDYHPLPQLITRIHTQLQQLVEVLEAKEKLEPKRRLESFFQETDNNLSAYERLAPESIRVHFIIPDRIKQLIWNIDSAPNVRRPKTAKMAQSLIDGEGCWEWKKFIASIVQKERRRLLEMYTTSNFSSTQITNYIQSIGATNKR